MWLHHEIVGAEKLCHSGNSGKFPYAVGVRHYLFESVCQRQTNDSSANDQHGLIVDRHLESGDDCFGGLFALFDTCACGNKAAESESRLANGW